MIDKIVDISGHEMELLEIIHYAEERTEEYAQPYYNYLSEQQKTAMKIANMHEDAPEVDECLIERALSLAEAKRKKLIAG